MARRLPLSANPVHAILVKAGRAEDISSASKVSAAAKKPVEPSAVHKWRWSGIPEEHWALVIDLAETRGSSVTVQEIYDANSALRALLDSDHSTSTEAHSAPAADRGRVAA
jgi:hypothetical protein